ncbi:hypothetical protein Rsub_11609 [Raphidocelis subcapitata]|uniref:Uncharacterized protein n=1 Tax=Raphidocelis subcapitata TaxID=307507 RepID=A0A2V0PH71_9CHLO|nr:hypothetical protein Rsub_11609 [Raphidocelis subcapitata]|eukprot:GBF99164.1 hypothetical protein Rsub_11609 [Raphidocelis subcapitata]
MVPRRRAALALLAAVAASCCVVGAAAKKRDRVPTELSNSFIITTLQDLEPTTIRGMSLTPCEYAVRRAQSLGQKHFSIVVTAYWAGDQWSVQHYSFKDLSKQSTGRGVGFPKPTTPLVLLWKAGLERCFNAAVSAGFSGIQILNHIDHEEGATWRNFVTFDPAARYDGWSYEDVVLWPAAQALKAAMGPDTRAWFMLSGEMGRSLWAFPERYHALLSKYRALLNGGRRKGGGGAKVGVALHWNKVCGNCFDMPDTRTHGAYNATYHRVFAEQRGAITSRFNTPKLRELFDDVDVVGISHYAPSPSRGVNAGAFSLPIDTTAYELSHWGVDLKKLIRKGDKDFLFSEVGLGGGDQDNKKAAGNLLELATNIHNGIWAVYNVAQDPWRNADYKEFRREWFKALTEFLYAGGAPHRVDAAFIWSVGTWDVAAIHPISTSDEGTYADWEIVKWMRWLSGKASAAAV